MDKEELKASMERIKAASKNTENEPDRPSWQPSSKWDDGGYPWRHRKALQRELGRTGVPWLYWDEPATTDLLRASGELNAGDALMILLGPRGTGKTQAAVEMSLKLDIYLQECNRPIDHMYMPLGELLNKEKASWDDKTMESPIKKAKSVGLLVLDEIQESTASDWERQQLTLLIDDRYRSMKRTIMIGNLVQSGLEKFVSKSISSRIQETGQIIEMAGKRYR